jgi:hypothetical protein
LGAAAIVPSQKRFPRARSETAGFVAHFVKPVDLDELKHALERLPVGEAGAEMQSQTLRRLMMRYSLM